MRAVVAFMVLICLSFGSAAKSLGVFGETFPIREMSFLDFITLRLKELSANGAFETMEAQWQERAKRHIDRPEPIDLPRATQKRIFHYDTSMILNKAILDAKGQILYPSGTRVNALEQLPNYTPCWLLFNGDDMAQMRWAASQMTQCKHPKLILTGGSVRKAVQELDSIIYFDQGGRLSSRFKLHALPARITRDVNRLQIEEVVIKENGDAL